MRTSRLLLFTLLAGCTAEPEPPPAITSTDQALAGREGKIDYGVDAPWRIEPVGNSVDDYEYGPIPIQITIDDAHLAGNDDYVRLGNLIDVTVEQHVPSPFIGSAVPVASRTYHLEDLAEIELEAGPWRYTGLDDALEQTRPLHSICEPWKGMSCEGARDIGSTAKWYALAWFEPDAASAEPGADIPLSITVRVEAQLAEDEPYGELVLKGHTLVHLGEAPLPTFGAGWLYGDLHYHSQATDNEGESGHSFRGVVRAMGAMGLGFAFATDHASYSEQIVDADLRRIPGLPKWAIYGVSIAETELRDMSPERFRYATERINDPSTGANRAATDNQDGIVLPSVRQQGIIPKLFMGAEVDVGPEVTGGERFSGVHYGNGRLHQFHTLCTVLPWPLDDVAASVLGVGYGCEVEVFTEPSPTGPGLYWAKDWQGLGLATSRQHVLHLPSAPEPEAFVPSRSSAFGGGTRAIHDVLGQAAATGVTFLAHPLSSQTAVHPGPNSVPYSEYQLLRAFSEETMLGLQIWNENGRLKTTADDDLVFDNTGAFGYLDSNGRGTCTDEPTPQCRLELVPTAGVTTTRIWEWQHSTTPTFGDMPQGFGPDHSAEDAFAARENKNDDDIRIYHDGLFSRLHHGAYTWDKMNLWGMDPARTASRAWLADGEPRRVFASAGSDAHGDFNYRRSGYFVGTDAASTTAMGTARNLLDLGASGGLPEAPFVAAATGGVAFPTPVTQGGVVSSLSAGRFAMTDGPALRIVVDNNRDGVIGPEDTPMGSIAHLYGDEPIPLLVEWASTREFGPVDEVHLYVAAVNDGVGRIYAPGNHGVRGDRDPSSEIARTYLEGDGKSYYELNDGYYLDPTEYGEVLYEDEPDGDLTIRTGYRAGDAAAYGAVQAITIDPARFPSGHGPTTGLFVRAFAKTAPEKWDDCENPAEGESLHRRGECLVRLAYTNPIWAVPQEWSPGDECPADPRGVDRDGDGYPDGCDYCPDEAIECGPDTEARDWAARLGGSGLDMVEAVAHDDDGNVYVAGNFQGTATIGTHVLTSAGAYDGFIVKLSRTGEVLWVEQIRGAGNMGISALVVDDLDAVTVAGWSAGNTTFGTYSTLPTASNGDMFIASYSAASGAPYLRWVRWLGGAGFDSVRNLALGPDRAVYAAGAFTHQLAVLRHVTGDAFTMKNSSGGYDCILFRMSPMNGAVTRSRQVWGSGHCFVDGIAVEDNHDVTMVGRYSGQARFDPSEPTLGVRTSTTGYNGYAVRYRPSSSTFDSPWNVSFGDTAGGCSNGDAAATGVARQNGGLVITGYYRNCAVAHGATGTHRLGTAWESYTDGFIVRLNQWGGVVRSSRVEGFGGDVFVTGVSGTDTGYAVSGYSHAALVQMGSHWFGSVLSGSPWGPIFAVARSDDSIRWAERFATSSDGYGGEVSMFRDGFVAMGGRFAGAFTTLTGAVLPSAGSADGFVVQTRP